MTGRAPLRQSETPPATVRALPLWQPWASLVIHGRKQIETRHWPAPQSIIGQRIAIHATKTKNELWVVGTEPFRRVLSELRGQGVGLFDPHNPKELPLGALLGTVEVVGCDPMTNDLIESLRGERPDEYAFGHYAVGRFAWLLADPRPLPEPVPWRGSQGIFSVPASVVHVELPDPAQGVLL